MPTAVLEKDRCPQCGSNDIRPTGKLSRDKKTRQMECRECGRRFLEEPSRRREAIKRRVALRKAQIEARKRERQRKRAEPQVVKVKRYCSECGYVLGDSNKSGICSSCRKEIIERARQKQYIKLDVEYDKDGVPFCIDCGSLMVWERGKWSCPNEKCSVISLSGIRNRFKVTRDTVMASEISGNAVMLEV